MTHQMHGRWRGENAYPELKILILTTIGTSLLAAFFTPLQPILALSLAGIRHFFLWQPLTQRSRRKAERTQQEPLYKLWLACSKVL